MNTAGPIDWIVLVVYFAAMAGLGPFFARRNRTTEGYFLGDRSFPGWLVGISMFATSISSVTFVAYPGDAYRTAWLRMLPNFMMPIAILMAVFIFIPFFRRTKITSAFEYLEDRFGPSTRLYAAIAFITMQMVRVALILFLVSLLVEQITGLDKYYSVILGGVITSFYSILGGIRAVLWTDFIQAIVLWVGGMVCIVVIVANIGLGTILSEANADRKFAFGELMQDGTDSVVLAGSAENTGELTVTVPASAEPGDEYFIRVTALGVKGISDKSNVNITIGEPAGTGASLLEPCWGDYWVRGVTQHIRWTPDAFAGPVRISLLNDRKPALVLAESTENTGEFAWAVPADFAPGAKYQVALAPVANPESTVESRTYFSIADALPANSLVITTPNGGNVWAPGSEQTIRWESTTQAEQVEVALVSGRGIAPASLEFSLTKKTIWVMLLIGLTIWLAEYSSNQNVVQRYAAAKSAKEARRATWICMFFSVPTWGLFMFLGTCLYVYYKHHHSPEATAILHGIHGAKAEEILPFFILRNLPMGLSGLVIAGVLSAAMSSLSSSISSVSAVGIVDIYQRHLVKEATESHYLFAAKMIGVLMGVVMIVGAWILMASDTKTLQDVATILAAVTAGGLLGLYLLGFLTTVGDSRSVAVGIVCTVAFSTWMGLSDLQWIPEAFRSPIDSYWTGILGHLIMFVLGFGLGLLLPKRPRNLHNLTVWTSDKTPVE
jgi:Na+/proline symporter